MNADFIDTAEFDRIVTQGEVGVQIIQPIGRFIFRGGIETEVGVAVS